MSVEFVHSSSFEKFNLIYFNLGAEFFRFHEYDKFSLGTQANDVGSECFLWKHFKRMSQINLITEIENFSARFCFDSHGNYYVCLFHHVFSGCSN